MSVIGTIVVPPNQQPLVIKVETKDPNDQLPKTSWFEVSAPITKVEVVTGRVTPPA